MDAIEHLPDVEPLPSPKLVEIVSGVSLLQPLSRRGTGPGMIVIVPDSESSNLEIREGVPSLLIKWAEESYTVVEIQVSCLTENPESKLQQAVEELHKCPKCEPKESIGLVVYDSSAWNKLAPLLGDKGSITAAAVYSESENAFKLKSAAVPIAQHLSGKALSKLERSDHFIAYDYPSAKSSRFAVPFQNEFIYAIEAISHTRNLTFLKRHMNGPYFDLEAIWDEHTYFEFEARSVEHTMSTMVQEPYVNHIPTMTGGIGRERLTHFYRNNFIFNNPKDTVIELISRTVGIDRVVDEFIFKLTHTMQIDWLLPGIPPTGKKVEIPFLAVVNIRGDRLYHEHISWDQATALAQLDLLPEYLPFHHQAQNGSLKHSSSKAEYRLPVAGVHTAQKVRDQNALPSNEMFKFELRHN